MLDVRNLKKYFPVEKGFFKKVTGWIKAVDNVSFSIQEGQTFSLVGESGCGKTTTAKVILLLEKATSGSIFFRGSDIVKLDQKGLSQYRASVQAVFQDPYSSLDPRKQVGFTVGEPLMANKVLPSDRAIKEKVEDVLSQVGLDWRAPKMYPHEFSGGQRQRIAIARALVLNPSLVVLDEPVSALDVSVRAQIMNLLVDLQERLGVAYLLIAHNLATVRYMSHQMGVMYLGKIAERGPSEELYSHPLHPYTKALLASALPFHPDAVRKEIILTGEVPTPLNPPSGCRFYPRCFSAKPLCEEVEPPLKEVANSHLVSCHLY